MKINIYSNGFKNEKAVGVKSDSISLYKHRQSLPVNNILGMVNNNFSIKA